MGWGERSQGALTPSEREYKKTEVCVSSGSTIFISKVDRYIILQARLDVKGELISQFCPGFCKINELGFVGNNYGLVAVIPLYAKKEMYPGCY